MKKAWSRPNAWKITKNKRYTLPGGGGGQHKGSRYSTRWRRVVFLDRKPVRECDDCKWAVYICGTNNFFFSKKKQWLHDISLQNFLIVHAKRSEQVLRGALTRGGACWQADTQAIVIPYFLEYSQPEPIISFLASKGGDYSREATISNIAHCESCSKYFVLLSQ